MDLKTQQARHKLHPPRVRWHNQLKHVVEVYSPVLDGYMIVGEHKTAELAYSDLNSWEEAWQGEQERFKRALG